MTTLWQRLARAGSGDDYARVYAERFRALAAEQGDAVHGEATWVETLVAPPASVLDAGCGTGRIAVRLAARGYEVVGCDVDASMVAVAREEAPELDWRVADLATVALGRTFDLVLLAGNIFPLLEPGTLAPVCASLTAHVGAGGCVLAGFGLDAAHLPPGVPEIDLGDVDAAFAAVGMGVGDRWSSWDGASYDDGSGYVVTTWTRGSRHEAGMGPA